jgi:glutamate carboxypeptidase
MRINHVKIALAILLSFQLVTAAHGQALSVEEKRIVDYVDASSAEAVALLEKTVNIESPTENLDGVREVGAVFMNEFRSIGLQSKWIPMPAGMKSAGHLFAETSGTSGKRILLLGHLDTVLAGERFRREGQKAFGTGTADMKAGNVVLYFALKALHSAGVLKDARISILLTGDEEDAGVPISISRADMIAAAKNNDLVLSFENGGSNIATVARRGYSDWELEVTAKTGHSSAIFEESMGSGAIFEASRILNDFYYELKDEKYLTFNPSIIAGGTEVSTDGRKLSVTGKGNVVPARVIVRGDLRFISEEQKTAAREKMTKIVAKSLPGASAKITFRDEIPAMSPKPANYELLEVLDRVSQDLGLGQIKPLDPGERGAGDISFIADLLPGLDGLGATGGKAHAKGEYADLDTLARQTKRAAILIYRLTRSHPQPQRSQ